MSVVIAALSANTATIAALAAQAALAAMTTLYWARLVFLAVLLLLSGALAGLAFGRSKR